MTDVNRPAPRRDRRPDDARATKYQRPRTARRTAERRGEPVRSEPAGRAGSRRSVALIWLGFAVAAVVVVLVVVVVNGGGSGGAASAEPIAADTTGTYSELVARANGLYDQGVAAFGKNDDTGGVAYFKAAAEVYRAAWKKQPGDPNVGTDFAVSLFYMRHHDEALQQIAVVLKKNPDFQPAYLNKGIFLQTESAEAKGRGEADKAAQFLEEAKVAFEKAVSIDPTSETGKGAAKLLKDI
jgi:tetratricopeptide (TPR) repeat protein